MDIGKVTLDKTVYDMLKQYTKDVDSVVNEEISACAKKALSGVKKNAKSYRWSDDYVKGWKKKELRTKGINHYEVVIHNATKPGLVHLLEKGHDVTRKKGGPVLGRSDAYSHVAAIAKQVEEELPARIMKRIQKGI